MTLLNLLGRALFGLALQLIGLFTALLLITHEKHLLSIESLRR